MKKSILAILIGVGFLFSAFRDYGSKVISVYDGDTITVSMYLGLGISKEEKIRMYGINAPEMRGAEKAKGKVSRDALRKKILGKDIVLKTIDDDKRGKYGRLLGVVYIDGVNVNEWMVEKGYAVFKKY